MAFDSDLEEIKARIDIVDLISDSVALKKAGRNYKGLCPFHPEKTPSFTVSQEKQIFHCFGCSAGGDIFGFVMRQEGLSFPEAKALLARKAGVTIKAGPARDRGLRDSLISMLKEAQALYSETLKKSKPAMAYLKNRGIGDEAIITFGLGYAPEEWHAMCDRLRGKKFKDELILQSGLVSSGKKGPYDIFRSRVTFPIIDLNGDPIAMGGRIIGEGEPKYLNSPDTPLFKKRETLYALNLAKDEIRKKGYSVLVEGYMDVIMCHQYGIKTAVAPLGTALTEGHVRKLKRYAENVLLVFDSDRAGIAAARRSLSILLEHGMRAKVLLLPEGEDPDTALRRGGGEEFGRLMNEALPPVRFVLQTSALKDKAAKVREAISMVSSCADPLIRDEYISELADRTRSSEATIREELKRVGKTAGDKTPTPLTRGIFAFNEEALLLSTAIYNSDRTNDILKLVGLEDFRDPMIKGLFGKLRDSGGKPALEVADTDDERALLTRLSVNPGFDPENIDRIIEDCIHKIRKKQIGERMERIDADIRSAEKANDAELLNRLLLERQRLSEETP